MWIFFPWMVSIKEYLKAKIMSFQKKKNYIVLNNKCTTKNSNINTCPTKFFSINNQIHHYMYSNCIFHAQSNDLYIDRMNEKKKSHNWKSSHTNKKSSKF